MPLTVGSLFAGIGGFDLAAERAGLEVKWQVEIDPFCRAVLANHWPHVRRYEDVRTVGNELERVDIICGGFPCQDISFAGPGTGLDGARSSLWFQMRRVAGELRPRFILVENSAALLGRGLGRVLGDLASLGYDTEWHCIPASHFGAPHERDRIWIIADAEGFGRRSGWARRLTDGATWLPDAPRWNPADTNCESALGPPVSWRECSAWPDEPALLGMDDGIPARVDRVRALGNAIVPQVAEWIFRQILHAEAESVAAR